MYCNTLRNMYKIYTVCTVLYGTVPIRFSLIRAVHIMLKYGGQTLSIQCRTVHNLFIVLFEQYLLYSVDNVLQYILDTVYIWPCLLGLCVCLCVCVCVSELLLDRSTDPLHFWWKGASHTRITPYLYFVTLNYTSRSPRPLRSPSPVHKKSTLD